MSIQNFFLSLLLFVSFGLFGEFIYEFSDTTKEKRFYNLISEVRCPKCTSGSIASSDAPVSRDLKDRIYQLIREGKSDQEIKSYVSDRFGAFSDYSPPKEGVHALLWFAPSVFLWLLLLIFFMRRRF